MAENEVTGSEPIASSTPLPTMETTHVGLIAEPIKTFRPQSNWTDNRLLILGLLTTLGLLIIGNMTLVALGKAIPDGLIPLATSIVGGFIGYLSKDVSVSSTK